jgi:glycosyltransferase involved in cell wall biosynthesis
MIILMISSTFPYPPSRGGTEIRTFNLLRHLSQHHSVTLVTQRPDPDDEATSTDTSDSPSDADLDTLRQWVDELVVFPLARSPDPRNKLAKVGRFAESWLKGMPPNVLFRYNPTMHAWVDEAVRSQAFDVITCEHSVNEIYIRPQTRLRVPTVVDVHSSVYAWTRNHLEMGASPNALRDRLYLPLLERYENRYCQKFSRIVVTTEDDRKELQRLRPDVDIDVIPNGVDLELFPYRQQDPGDYRLVYVGAMDASHNIDAARFFALQVMPALRQRYPDATFAVVGARPAPEVLALKDCPGVEVTGAVDSMVTQLHQATVCVVPLRTGFGIKNKTLEAMAAGVPVVGSDRGLEGLAVDQPGIPRRALRANDVDSYVSAIGRLFDNPDLRSQLAQAAREMVEATYTWEQAGKAYEQALTATAMTTRALT